MRVAVVVTCVLAVALAAPLLEDTTTVTSEPFEYSFTSDDLGQYTLSYETNQSSQVEQGSFKSIDGATVLVKQGSFEYVDANGKKYITSYTADENGFHPVGDHIPVVKE